jgi:hypothetical protein
VQFRAGGHRRRVLFISGFDTLADDLARQDKVRVLVGRTEAGRFVAGFAPPILEIASPVQVGPILSSSILNHTPLPFVQNVGVRFFLPQGEIWASGKDPILFFGRDEWQASIPPGATRASIRVSPWPFEIALDEKGLDLTM